MTTKCNGYDYILLNAEHYERDTDIISYAFEREEDAKSVMRKLVDECVKSQKEDFHNDVFPVWLSTGNYCEVMCADDLWYSYEVRRIPRRINDDFVSVNEDEDFIDINKKGN